jgi:PKD repeat protein
VTCGNVPVSVQFNDTSAGNPTSWYWDLGEGTNSTERNPLFIYNTTGVFSINHSATNEYGTSWINQTDYLRSIPSYDVCTAPGGTTGARYIVNGISGIWLYIILGLAAAFLAIYGVMDLRNRFYANIVSLFMSSLLTFYLSVTVGNGTLHYGILIDQIAGTTTPIILKDTSLGWLLIIPAVAAMIATSYLVYDAYSESKGNGEED